MSTERRRSAGGRRRANGPSGDARGNGGRRRADGPARDERSAGRRRARDEDSSSYGGFWDDDERPSRRRAQGAAAEGGRRRAEGQQNRSGQGRRAAAHGARAEGGRRAAGGGGGGRRRPPQRHEEPDDRGRFKRFMSKAWKPALVTCGVLFVAGVAFVGIAYALTPGASELDPKSNAKLTATTISYADDKGSITTGQLNRQPVSMDQVPDTVVNGVLGSEQRDFYEQPGISITGTMRAVLTGGQAGGGSSITQQMARNYYDALSRDRSIVRKFKEILISIKLGQQMPPDKILEQYLNTIYFGRGAYGIQAASQAYFGKDVEDINAAEGAFLGSIIQQPGNFENVQPGSDMEDVLKGRWDYARDGMGIMYEESGGEYGIPKEEAEKLEFPKTVKYNPQAGKDEKDYEAYMRRAVTKELQQRYGLSAQEVATGGYRVKTSLDKHLMETADKVFDKTLPDMPKETMYGLAAVDPKTGEIRAFHGGEDIATEPNNSLPGAQGHRAQAGSAFKPYVLATGLEQGIGLKSTFDGDSPQEFPGVGEPIQNDSNKSYGPVNLVKATADSINTAYVQLAIETTPQAVTETARKAGVGDEQLKTADMGPNIALGTYQVSALDQAVGFATFANQGVHMPQHMVTEVTTKEGEKLEPKDADLLEEGKRAFSADVAADATYAMTQVVENGGGDNAALPDGRPVAGKTGTSNSAKSAWFVGYTPQLSTSIGLSRSDGKKLKIPGVPNIYGGTTSAKIWREFMKEAMKGKPKEEFPPPAYIGDKQSFLPTPTESPDPTRSQEPSRPPEESESPSPSTPPSPSDGPSSPECLPWEDCETQPPDEPTGGPNDPQDPPGQGDDDDGGGGIFG